VTYVCVFSQDEQNKICLEKIEEAKLRDRYPNLGNKPGGSDLLRKRLQKGVRFIHILSFYSCWWDENHFILFLDHWVIRRDTDHRSLVVLHWQ